MISESNISFSCYYGNYIPFREESFVTDWTALQSFNESCTRIYKPELFKLIVSSLVDINGTNYGLFSIEPFKSNKNKFNFWFVNNTYSLDYECGQGSIQHYWGCIINPKFSSNCSLENKHIIDVGGRPLSAITAWHLITSAVPIFVQNASYEGPYVTHDWITTFVHEAGHFFSNDTILDEYGPPAGWPPIFQGYGSQAKNCYAGPLHTKEECLQNAPWRNMINGNYYPEVGCFEGCLGYGGGIFRSVDIGIMNSGFQGRFGRDYSYGSWNEKLISNYLNTFQ